METVATQVASLTTPTRYSVGYDIVLAAKKLEEMPFRVRMSAMTWWKLSTDFPPGDPAHDAREGIIYIARAMCVVGSDVPDGELYIDGASGKCVRVVGYSNIDMFECRP